MNADIESTMPAPSTKNPLSLFLDVWMSPTQGFTQLKDKPRIWYPFFAIILAQIALSVYFAFSVDAAWMVDQMANANPNITPEQRDAMASMQTFMAGGIGATVSAIGIAIMFPLIFSIFAGYYTIISSFTADGIRFGQWLGLICWSSTPMVFVAIASAITILLSENGQILQTQLNPLSLNSLFFKLPAGVTGSTFFSSVDLSMIWTSALTVIGYRTWTQKSLGTACLVALTPPILILTIVAYFSFT